MACSYAELLLTLLLLSVSAENSLCVSSPSSVESSRLLPSPEGHDMDDNKHILYHIPKGLVSELGKSVVEFRAEKVAGISTHFRSLPTVPLKPENGLPIGNTSSSSTLPNDQFRRATDDAGVRASMNESVNPCDDFYLYACGGWLISNPIPSDGTVYGQFQALRGKVNKQMRALLEEETPSTSEAINTLKQLYTACMNVPKSSGNKSTTALLQTLEKFGYWPMLHGVAEEEGAAEDNTTHPFTGECGNSSCDGLTELMMGVGMERGVGAFIKIYVTSDMRNIERHLLHFAKGGLGLPAHQFYLNTTRYSRQMAAYERYILEVLLQLGKDAGLQLDDGKVRRNVEGMIKFERRLAKLHGNESRNYTELYKVGRLSDMKELMPLLDWSTYLRALVPKDMHGYLNANPKIIIKDRSYFHRLNALLLEFDSRMVKDYVLWRYVSSWVHQLGESYDDIYQKFHKSLLGRRRKPPRWKDCYSAASGRMSYASGAMYVRRYFDKQDREAAQLMVEDIREAFRGMLLENDWMDESTKGYALEKAEQMRSLIGFPDFLYNDTALDEYYANPDDDYATAVEKAIKWARAKEFRKLTKAVDRSEFIVSSAHVNAYYDAKKNSIIVPAAILQPPFFDHHRPNALNYGSIGSVIGHEITHGFDSKASQFDVAGNLRNWWDPSTHSRFVNRTRCIVEQYSAYEVLIGTGLRLNGVLTENENIADNGGIKASYRAYRSSTSKREWEEPSLPRLEHFTNDQLFFIGYAQTWCGSVEQETAIRQMLTNPHSPTRVRVNAVLMNQPEFSSAFRCAAGTRMNPQRKRCAVW